MDQTEGIILRSVDFSETSLILTIFTRDFGKLSAIAKGGRRLKGPFESSLDLLSRVRLCVIQKHSDALDILTESKLIWRFHPNRHNFAGMYAGYVATELVNLFTESGDPAPELYDRLAQTLADFDTGKQVMQSLLRFEWFLLEQLGQRPELNFCVECGKDLHETESGSSKQRLYFAPLEGGVLCSDCREGHSFVSLLSPAAREAIEHLQNQDVALIDPSLLGEMRGITSLYYNHLAGRKIRIYELLDVFHAPKYSLENWY